MGKGDEKWQNKIQNDGWIGKQKEESKHIFSRPVKIKTCDRKPAALQCFKQD